MKAFDMHCDTLLGGNRNHWDLVNDQMHISLDKLGAFEHYVQCFAIFIPDQFRGQDAIDFYDRTFAYYQAQTEKYADRMEWAHNGKELAQAKIPITGILTIEGGCALAGDISRVKLLKEQGVAMMTLTWNGPNELGCGTSKNEGLTDFGKAAIKEMEKVGMLVDLSHISDAGFDDACSVATKPLIASHSNSRAVCGHIRNVTDEQFKEYVKRGGLVGLNYSKDFICDDPEKADFDWLYRHIEHFLSLGGEKVVALGSDFDGTHVPECLSSVEKNADFYEYLLKKNLNEDLVRDIFFENANRVFQEYVL